MNALANMYANVGLETGVEAASPHKLIDMLFDGAEGAVRRALAATEQGARSRAIAHATNIIGEGLRGNLDLQNGGEVAQRLDSLYEYLTSRLLEANVSQERAPLEEALKLLAGLHSAWRDIANGTPAAAHLAA